MSREIDPHGDESLAAEKSLLDASHEFYIYFLDQDTDILDGVQLALNELYERDRSAANQRDVYDIDQMLYEIGEDDIENLRIKVQRTIGNTIVDKLCIEFSAKTFNHETSKVEAAPPKTIAVAVVRDGVVTNVEDNFDDEQAEGLLQAVRELRDLKHLGPLSHISLTVDSLNTASLPKRMP